MQQKIPASGSIPGTVWALSLVSLLMDISSEMIHALLPLFMVGTLGAGTVWVGLVEGIGESTALVTKVFSGYIADRFGRKKWLVFAGYFLGVVSKPVFALAGAVPVVLAARFFDRLGKGLRGAPRDALVAEVTPQDRCGAAYGLRQSFDAAGGFLGPALAALLLWLWTEDFRSIFWVSLIPGALCLIVILLGVRETSGEVKPARAAVHPVRELMKPECARFRRLVLLGAVFSLARFSNAFIVLRAADCGIALALIPFVPVVMNFVFSLSCYRVGALSDRISGKVFLALGLVFLAAAQAVFALWATPAGMAVGVVLWGLHLGATQGIFAKLTAETAPESSRASAFGVFNFFSGLAALASGLTAGVLWELFGAGASFLAGSAFAVLCLVLFGLSAKSLRSNEEIH